jgi:soluble lytic murein transglycosylase-like protein
MKTHALFLRISIFTLGTGVCGEVMSADIFRSESPNGVVRYATQALDETYRIYMRDAASHVVAKSSRQVVAATPGSRRNEASVSQLIETLSKKHAVDPTLVRAIIDVESNANPNAVSNKGATGMMQLMSATAAMYGVTELTDPAQNIEAGILHLKYLLALHHGNLALVLAAYNAGEGAVARNSGRIPPYRETMLYVPAVLARLQIYRNRSTP